MEKKKPRVYSDEFRTQAVQLAKDIGNVSKAAKQLGIPEASLYAWKASNKAGKLASQGGAANSESEAEENKRLRREVAELKKVNHILKAAAAIFTRDHLS